MNEISELESGIDRLRRDSQSKKMLINALEKEKTELLRRSDELSERLTKTSEAYKESSRKIMDYVNSQVSQLRMDMTGLSSSMENLSGLEKRLESQEKSHEKALNRIGKELAIVGKSLSDVENLKSELSRQRSFFQDAKLRMDKSIQSGMAYLRKEMDVNRREDARKALEEFRQEIERISSIESELNAYKRSQGSRLDTLTDDLSSLKSSLADLRVLKDRSKSLEGITEKLEEGLSELSSRQKAASSLIANELSGKLEKDLGKLRKDLEGRRTEDTKAQLREFKQELQRIASLEQGLKENGKRLDSLGRELSSLQPTAEQVAILQDRVDENLHMNHSLADRTVSSSDFERAMHTMTKRAEELESKLFMVDKKLSSGKSMLEKSILEVLNQEKFLEGTQENIKQWFDGRFQDMEKRVSTGIDALTTQIEEGSNLVDRLKERSQKTDILTREVPARLEQHSKTLTKLLDFRADTSASMESLSGDIRTVSGGLSSSLQRIASLEKGLSSVEKANISVMENLGRDISSQKEKLASLSSGFTNSLDKIESLEKGLLSFDKSNRVNMGRFSSDLSAFQQELKVMKSSLSQTVPSGEFKSELSAVKSALSAIESRNKELAERMSSDIKSTRASLDKKLSDLTEEQASQFRKDFSYITKNIDTIRDLASDIKIFKSKVRSLEGFSKTRMSEQDFSQFRDIMDSRLSEMDASNRQSIDRLSQELAEFGKSVDSGKLSRDDFSKAYDLIETKLQDLGVMAKSSSDELRKDMVSFKRLVEERFNDIKGSQIKEFKDEISRISQLEQSTDARTDAHEKRLDELSKTLASLQSMPTEIGMIREKIDSLEELSGSMVYSREFSQKISEINTSLDQFRKGLTGLDKRMHSHSASLEASIREAFGEEKLLKKAQDGMNSLIDSRITEVEKRLSSGIRGLVNDLSQSSAALSGLKENISVLNSLSARADENSSSLDELRKRMDSLELASRETGKKASGIDDIMKRLAKLESLSRNIIDNSEFLKELGDEHSNLKAIAGTLPRTVEKHSEAISKILESKEFLADNVAGLRSDISGLSEKLSSSQERLASLEKGISSRGVSDESRIDELSSAVSSVETKLESSRNELKDFRENVITRVDEAVNSFEKRFGDISKNLSLKHSGGSQKSMAEISGLKERVKEIESLTRKLSKESVPESEFVETVRVISKRIDDMEKLSSDADKKGLLKSAKLSSVVNKALSREDILEASQKQVNEMFDSRLKDVRASLSDSVSKQMARLDSGLKDISALKQDITRIQALGERMDADVTSKVDAKIQALREHLDSDMMSKVDAKLNALEERLDSDMKSGMEERLSSHEKTSGDMEKKLESVSSKLISMNDSIIEEKGRISVMEQRLKASLDAQKAGIKEMFTKQKASIDNEIGDEASKIIKDAEIGELKRKQEFENLLRKFQEMHIKTQQNLDAISNQRESFLELEKNLKDRVDKATSSLRTRLSADQEKLKKRLDDSESLIMKLNNMISELHESRQKEKGIKLDFDGAISVLKEEMIDRMKTNEDMFDTEMDAFRNRVESISSQLSAWKDVQKQSIQKLPEAELMNKVISDLDIMKSRVSEMDRFSKRLSKEIVQTSDFQALNNKFQELYEKTQRNLNMLASQEQSLEETERKLSKKIASHSSAAELRLAEDYQRLKKRLEDSESMIANINNLVSGLQIKIDNKTDMKMNLDDALYDIKNKIDGRMKTMDSMISEFDALKNIQKSKMHDLPKADKKQLDNLSKTIDDMSRRLSSNKEEMKKFKEYVIEYMNNLVNTYEGRMKTIKDEIKR